MEDTTCIRPICYLCGADDNVKLLRTELHDKNKNFLWSVNVMCCTKHSIEECKEWALPIYKRNMSPTKMAEAVLTHVP